MAAINGTHQSHGQASVFFQVVTTRVDGLGTTAATPGDFRGGTLSKALIDTTPTTTTPPAIASLNSLAQDQAIEATRIAVVNGFNFNRSLNSGHGSKK